jgi:hypothetical protein
MNFPSLYYLVCFLKLSGGKSSLRSFYFTEANMADKFLPSFAKGHYDAMVTIMGS